MQFNISFIVKLGYTVVLRYMKYWILIIALGAGLASCHRGRPARKELPEYLGTLPETPATVTPLPSHLGARLSGNYLLYSTDTSLLIRGDHRDLLLLALPDPSHDSTIQAMIAAGQPLVPFLLTELHQQNKSGLVIDLRLGDNTPTIREDYMVTSAVLKERDFPVIFLWDRSSAGRAAAFTQYLEQFPNIDWSISNDRPRYQTDCFTDTRPTF